MDPIPFFFLLWIKLNWNTPYKGGTLWDKYEVLLEFSRSNRQIITVNAKGVEEVKKIVKDKFNNINHTIKVIHKI